ncbi:MAG: YtxH domain-containing protein [Myxococcota bacterium]
MLPALSIFSAGLVVGAALGVLFAPKRGEEVRGDIRHRLDDLRARGNARYDELRSERVGDAQES